MGYEHLVVGAAGVVEHVGVAVLLFGALVAALVFARRLAGGAAFQDATMPCAPISAGRSCLGWSCW